MRPENKRLAVWPALALIALLGWGCGRGTGEPAAEEELGQQAAAVEESVRPDVEAKLARADAFDGAVDRVVSRCAACGLAMDGSTDHTLQYGGYELRFCSPGCKQIFEADPEAGILALIIPEIPPDAAPPADASPAEETDSPS